MCVRVCVLCAVYSFVVVSVWVSECDLSLCLYVCSYVRMCLYMCASTYALVYLSFHVSTHIIPFHLMFCRASKCTMRYVADTIPATPLLVRVEVKQQSSHEEWSGSLGMNRWRRRYVRSVHARCSWQRMVEVSRIWCSCQEKGTFRLLSSLVDI
jgi:hypothetical protein